MAADSIPLVFDPLTLPTAQHRAGLAGLLLLVETMRRRGIEPLPEIASFEHRWTISVDRDSLQAIFNDLYAATTEEQSFPAKRTSGKGDQKKAVDPKREETIADPKTGKEKTFYVYDQIVPRAPFLEALHMPAPWLKLWRDAVWSTIRGIPKSRGPYESSASGQPVNEAGNVWEDLEKFEKARKRNVLRTVELSSSIYLGAQAMHADYVPFNGRTDDALLLHFWPVVMQVFVPRSIDRDGKESNAGYVLAVPDVTDVTGFVEDFPELLASLDSDMAGYRPAAAIVSLPQEGALEYFARVAAVARTRLGRSVIQYTTAAIEFFHLEKQGNNIRSLHAGRLTVTPRMLTDYEAVRRRYKHPLFRRQLVLNLLHGRAWYSGFQDVFAIFPHERFVGAGGAWFQADLGRKRTLEQEAHEHA